ncbi:MAG TPA: DNA mismatch repair protein MutS [Firmicutes bacterium]|uniref:DNA mismatch repair protein MutS n=1 Tax=Capillibacterium thermochitinicola TaxID=2699427 RepID=A0A8J6LJ10_9FIRM|nr:DNA mismatch repair protein MutS [Capillibacterium thermochitinicola]MBA2133291.1 DNA mismatch repair protein MutS [Capillibacterium thermochitinicola]HHW12470.1 DNA mismatch repair protein MutS [Bacillota bacterium]
MLKQYKRIKQEYADAILLFRLGDFYEMFLEDAEKAAEVLEIVLTSREAGKGKRIPMCGIPYHAATSYIARLLAKGFKVAICEQVEDPKKAKGLVKREVVRVITPGTLIDEQYLEEKVNNYLVALVQREAEYGLAVADLSTGDFMVTQFAADEALLLDELCHWQPKEILVAEDQLAIWSVLKQRINVLFTPRPPHDFQWARAQERLLSHFQVVSLEGYGCQELKAAVGAAGAVLAYFYETQKSQLEHILSLRTYHLGDFMHLDQYTRRNLELVTTLRDHKTQGSLLWVLDRTVTAAGGRLLKKWLEQPLRRRAEIEDRLAKVDGFFHQHGIRQTTRGLLRRTCDLQRLLAKLACQTVNPRDLLALRTTLALLPEIRQALQHEELGPVAALAAEINPLPDLTALLTTALREDPPVSVTEGNIFREGYNQELDTLIRATREGKQWIAGLEQAERERTGIKSLKVGYNQVFGYYLEVTKANLALVPADYIRKQTLANAERYVTPELKKYEELILGAEEKRAALEYQLFLDLRGQVLARLPELKRLAEILAQLDVYAALAETAVQNHYVRPEIHEDKKILIREGRHPVVERVLPPGQFVPNDTLLDDDQHRLQIITGPNMAGKSTYMRQVALIVLMAQIGSFVPASYARIGLVDRIFTRVGAADNLAGGQSTFMVEMSELANILHHATADSLLILDEIGRGTSTFDGLSIAWGVLEYLWNPRQMGARTLFATHYHELTTLAARLDGVENLNVAVAKEGDGVIFLHKILPGASDRSYGIEVARLAGIPEVVLARAAEILAELEAKGLKERSQTVALPTKPMQLTLFTVDEAHIYDELRQLDLNNISPLEALKLLFQWQQRLKQKKEA